MAEAITAIMGDTMENIMGNITEDMAMGKMRQRQRNSGILVFFTIICGFAKLGHGG